MEKLAIFGEDVHFLPIILVVVIGSYGYDINYHKRSLHNYDITFKVSKDMKEAWFCKNVMLLPK